MNLHECPQCKGRVSVLQDYDGLGNVQSDLVQLRCTRCLYASSATLPRGIDLAAVALADKANAPAVVPDPQTIEVEEKRLAVVRRARDNWRSAANAWRLQADEMTQASSALRAEVERMKAELTHATRPPHLPLGLPLVGLGNDVPCLPGVTIWMQATILKREYVTAFQVPFDVAKSFRLERLSVGVEIPHDRQRDGVCLGEYDDGTFGLDLRPVLAHPGIIVCAMVTNVSTKAAAFEARILGMPKDSCTCKRGVDPFVTALGLDGTDRRIPTPTCIVHRGA